MYLRCKVFRALTRDDRGEVGFEDVKGGFGGVWMARVGVKVDSGICLRAAVMAKGRRNAKAMIEM